MLQPLVPEAFERYGSIVAADGHAGRPINDGTSQRFDLPDPDVDCDGGRAALAVFRARRTALPFVLRTLERHRLGSQTFVPLGGAPFAVVVAWGASAPEPPSMRAFRVDGRSGVTIARGIWHHPLLALADGDFVVLERRGTDVDCELAAVPETRIVEG
ncbi:MAG TPA: ureidoglycolate lyase [Zeimonas sp.]